MDKPDRGEGVGRLLVNALISRASLLSRSADHRRSIPDECGYVKGEISVNQYQDMYDRQAIGARVVEVLPRESWQVLPKVYEDEAATVRTDFEKTWNAIGRGLRGEPSYYEDQDGGSGPLIWEYLLRADILSGVGRFGVILFGIDDGKDLSEPAQGRTGTIKKFRDLNFLRVFPESLVEISEVDRDPDSVRYMKPLTYSITFSAPGTYGSVYNATHQVHWSRVLHITDNIYTSETYSVPRLQTV